MNIGSRDLFDIRFMDTLAAQDSFLHRLDPRAKLVTTLAFIITVVSFDKYSIFALAPYVIYPVFLISAAGLPAGYLLKKTLAVSPFAILVGIFNPVMDSHILMQVGPMEVSGGWVSFFSILLRFFLTVTAAFILIALTGFNAVCDSLLKFGVPRPFVTQLLFFYRYIWVLTDEAERMLRARTMRSPGCGAVRFNVFVSLINHLLLRTLDRAERIYLAMCCRGFDGRMRVVRPMGIGWRETIFVLFWVSAFACFRYFDLSLGLGKLVTGF